MPILEKGCCCCDLTTCVKVQGFLFTALFLGLAVADCVLLAVWIVPKERNPGPDVDDFGKRIISDMKVVGAALAGCLLAWMVMGVLLLVGIYKRKRQLMWPYMVLGGLNVLGTAGLLLYYASSVHTRIPNMMVMLAFLALQFYLLLHVVSLFQRLAAEERQRRVGRTDYG